MKSMKVNKSGFFKGNIRLLRVSWKEQEMTQRERRPSTRHSLRNEDEIISCLTNKRKAKDRELWNSFRVSSRSKKRHIKHYKQTEQGLTQRYRA